MPSILKVKECLLRERVVVQWNLYNLLGRSSGSVYMFTFSVGFITLYTFIILGIVSLLGFDIYMHPWFLFQDRHQIYLLNINFKPRWKWELCFSNYFWLHVLIYWVILYSKLLNWFQYLFVAILFGRR